MKKIVYKKNNNLLQSASWKSFLESYGNKTIDFGDSLGIIYQLPFNKTFIWLPKGPDFLNVARLLKQSKSTNPVFIRIEPQELKNDASWDPKIKPISRGSLLSGLASPKATRILDISGDEEQIQKNMKSKTRYNIKLSQKRGVIIKIKDDPAILYDLLTKTASRERGFHPHPKNYYEKMIKNLSKDGLGHLFVAEFNKKPIAAIFVTFFGEVATYLHGGFDSDSRNLMAPFLCQWEAIKYAKKKGLKYYDFWGVAEDDDPDDPWQGISRFKEGFGGEKITYPGTYDLVLSKFWYNVFSVGSKIKHLIKK